jgi:hypothetical protein
MCKIWVCAKIPGDVGQAIYISFTKRSRNIATINLGVRIGGWLACLFTKGERRRAFVRARQRCDESRICVAANCSFIHTVLESEITEDVSKDVFSDKVMQTMDARCVLQCT